MKFKKEQESQQLRKTRQLTDSTFESTIEAEFETEKNVFTRALDWMYKHIYKKFKTFRHLLIWYVLITLVGALFLYFPFTQVANPGVKIEFIDALFLAASAFSDTGLTMASIGDTYNAFGQSIIFVLIQLGGIGWFAIKVFFIAMIIKKVRTSTVDDAAEEMGTDSKKLTLGIVKVAVITTILSTIVAGFIFGIVFATVEANPVVTGNDFIDPGLVGNWGQSIWTGLFHAGASINNAGFDIFAGDISMQAYYGNVGIQVLTLFLFILGGIGFTVIYDIKEWAKTRYSGKKFKFSLVTKISVVSYVVVSVIGLTSTYAIEYTATQGFLDSAAATGNAGFDWWALTFNTFSTRNAGFSTFDISTLSPATKGTWSVMMFIGSGPGSTAGGLRTTTVAILFLSIIARAKNQEQVSVFNRSVSKKQSFDAAMIFIASVILVFASSIIITAVESTAAVDSKAFLDYFFLTNSAYGTTGLSTLSSGAIHNLHVVSKLNIILLMFVGQLGIITTMKNMGVTTSKKEKARIKYIEESVNLGH